ncbi:MAG: hypothetical protein M3229_02090, partial [Actinomycetota bacterium]|nr:hypothetical protein [Actinomycetota bacterium]
VWGIRVSAEVETSGLDVAEHGMWGYPELYTAVPGGYGSDGNGHLRLPRSSWPAVVESEVA